MRKLLFALPLALATPAHSEPPRYWPSYQTERIVIVPPRQTTTCPLDGPGAWDCNRRGVAMTAEKPDGPGFVVQAPRSTERDNDDSYDAAADMENSLAECYRAVRERKAAGGPGWSG